MPNRRARRCSQLEPSHDAMRNLRGVLRQADEMDAREPLPGVARIPELIALVCRAGVGKQVPVEGASAPLTLATDLPRSHRAKVLTNIIRHALGASAEVPRRTSGTCQSARRPDWTSPTGLPKLNVRSAAIRWCCALQVAVQDQG